MPESALEFLQFQLSSLSDSPARRFQLNRKSYKKRERRPGNEAAFCICSPYSLLETKADTNPGPMKQHIVLWKALITGIGNSLILRIGEGDIIEP